MRLKELARKRLTEIVSKFPIRFEKVLTNPDLDESVILYSLGEGKGLEMEEEINGNEVFFKWRWKDFNPRRIISLEVAEDGFYLRGVFKDLKEALEFYKDWQIKEEESKWTYYPYPVWVYPEEVEEDIMFMLEDFARELKKAIEGQNDNDKTLNPSPF